jgi:hypothetical protein
MKMLSLNETARVLNISAKRARRLRRLGIITPSAVGNQGELYNSLFVENWRKAMSMTNNPPKQ